MTAPKQDVVAVTGDYTLDERLVEEWHQAPEDGTPLHVYMRLSHDEYRAYVERNTLPLDFEARHNARRPDDG